LANATNLKIQSCDIINHGVTGISTNSGCNLITASNNTIAYINNSGIYAPTPGWTVEYNNINHIANIAGMGVSGDGQYNGIVGFEDNSLIDHNNILTLGFNGISVFGNNVTVQNNFIDTFCLVKDDAAAIYSGNAGSGRIIRNNIVINGIGAGNGTVDGQAGASGIYIDDNGSGFNIYGNTVANCALSGIFLHNAHDITITGNTCYNNETTFAPLGGGCLINYDGGGTPVSNIIMNNNIFFAKTSAERTANYSILGNPSGFAGWGTINNNYYARPIGPTNSTHTFSNSYSLENDYTPAQWTTASTLDANSKQAPKSITTTNDLRFEYNATTSNKVVNLGAAYIDAAGVSYPGTITLAPYTSAVLIYQSGVVANQLPVASAGPDKSITLPTNSVTLTGSGTDADGTIASHQWTKVVGPAQFAIVSSTQALTTINNMIQGVYQFELKVTDNQGAIGKDTVTITVNGTSNQAPVANAGSDKTIILPTNNATLSGTGTDADGTIASYSWSKQAGGAATLSGATTATLNLSGLVAGTYVFRLSVTDNGGVTGIDDVTVIETSIASPSTLRLDGGLMSGTSIFGGKTFVPLLPYLTAGIGWDSDEGATLAIPITNTLNDNLYQTECWGESPVTTYAFPVSNGNYTVHFHFSDWAPTVTQKMGDRLFDVALQGAIVLSNLDIIAEVGKNAALLKSFDITVASGAITITFTNKVFFSGISAIEILPQGGAALTVSALAANAGTDKVITLPTNSVTQIGSGISGNGTIAAYQWTKVSGPAQFTILTPTQSQTVINTLAQGIYQFELKVTDNLGATAKDTVIVTVNVALPQLNQSPLANAGVDKTITLPTNTVTLTGSGTDADGTIVSYQWTKILGPAQFTIASPTQLQTVINNLAQGIYQFELKVTDNLGATAKDTVIVSINAAQPQPNQPPLANAGADKTIALPTNTVTLTGSGTDADGTVASYQWSKVSGPALFAITSPTQSQTTINNLVEGIYVFELKITDNLTASGKDSIKVIVNAAVSTANKYIKVNLYGGVNPYNNIEWNNWNSNASLSSTVFNYSDGTTSPVSAKLNYGLTVVDNLTGYGGVMAPAEVLRYASYSTKKRILTITGLSTSKAYSLELYASMNANQAYQEIFKINQIPVTVVPFNNLTNTARFVNIVPNSQGQIIISISSSLWGYNYLNGFMITDSNNVSPLSAGRLNTQETQEEEVIEKNKSFEVNEASLKIFPNPVKDNFILEINNSQRGKMSVQMIDQAGAIRHTFSFNKDQQTNRLNLSTADLSNGVYFIRVQIGNWNETRKIIKL